MTVKAPIREAMFSSPGILSKMWVKFFAKIDEEINSSSEESIIINAPNSINSTYKEVEGVGALALALLPSQISTKTSGVKTDDILTLYWMGV